MKMSELRSQTDVELQLELARLARESFELRMVQVSSQEKRTHRASAMRRDVARIRTILRERQIAASLEIEEEAPSADEPRQGREAETEG